MKKVLSLMLVVLLCLTFTACGDDDKAAANTTPSDSNAAPVDPNGGTPVVPETGSIVGAWTDNDGFTWTFNADGTLAVSDGTETMTINYTASGNSLTMTMDGQTTTGTFVIAGNTLTLTNADGQVKTLTKGSSPIQVPSLVTPTVPTVPSVSAPTVPQVSGNSNNIGNPSDEQVVSATVELIKDQLAEKFEEMFAQKGLVGTAEIRADGTRLVIDLSVVALNNASAEDVAEMRASAASSLQGVVDSMLANIRVSLPQVTGAAFNVCDGNGNVLVTVSAGY